MSLNHGVSEAQPLYTDSTDGAVREIYPGASSAPRIKARTRRGLMASEAGMATADTTQTHTPMMRHAFMRRSAALERPLLACRFRHRRGRNGWN